MSTHDFLPEFVAQVRALEWSRQVETGIGVVQTCPECTRETAQGHDPGCSLGDLLRVYDAVHGDDPDLLAQVQGDLDQGMVFGTICFLRNLTPDQQEKVRLWVQTGKLRVRTR